MITVESAGRLLDFSGRIAEDIAEGQLRGAVALHNILEREGVAYLADEVGMGKTLVALGVLALYRHWNPNFRALIIAPRENIQKKWGKEFRQFARNNVRYRDLRVRALHDAPARALVHCTSVLDLLHETILDPDRDFIARMTSFSLPFGQEQATKAKRDRLLELLPWLDTKQLDARQNKDAFKHNFGRALCCGIPEFDLVIVDEAHNLKHGFGSGAVRNRVMGLMFGRDDEPPPRGFPGYGLKARRVLFLSATPVEDTYRQLWNQLDVFGKAASFEALVDKDASDEDRRDCARRILIRRITSLNAAGKPLTKNLYRREWRQGGVETHDDMLTVPDDKSRLVVALVQKKVSETLSSPRFNNQFQIGMLASFESFMETAGFRVGEDGEAPASFGESEQATDELERRGADVGVLNRLARDYRRKFAAELPHPKMDAVVDGLARSFGSGEKALVFVRRVASVRELKRKLDEKYDEHLLLRLRQELLNPLVADLEILLAKYREERRRDIESGGRRGNGGDSGRSEAEPDQGGKDSFFAWFFRGEGPRDYFSGATLQRRFTQASAALGTFFEDNWIAWLFDVRPAQVLAELASYLGRPAEALEPELQASLRTWIGPGRAAERRNFFLGYQRAALELIAAHEGAVRSRAQVILDHRFREAPSHGPWTGNVPPASDWLGLRTFFTELRVHDTLAAELDIDGDITVPTGEAEGHDRFIAEFRRRETRRELVSGICRLGHPIIDLFILMANRIGTLRSGARAEGEDDLALIRAFMMRLEEQAGDRSCFTSYREIRDALVHADLLIDLNLPDARTAPIDELPTLVGRLLREQQPIGGMAGRVNETLVRQFRMPGYPFVLVSTDLLQEGEDLHTFCSSVLHYGISWMPSSMEQRTGRIDRVNSATQRRLGGMTCDPAGSDLLQVYYPHLRDTVEVLQVDRVLHRMGEFVRMMHEDLIVDRKEEKQIDVVTELVRPRRIAEIPSALLTTAFPVTAEMLHGEDRPLAVDPEAAARLRERFQSISTRLSDPSLEWHDTAERGSLIGILTIEERRQPFALFLRATAGRMLVRCVSPIGHVSADLRAEILQDWKTASALVRIAMVDEATESRGPRRRAHGPKDGSDGQMPQGYDLTVEGDVVLSDPAADIVRVHRLIRDVAQEADAIEEEYLTEDTDPGDSLTQLRGEAKHER